MRFRLAVALATLAGAIWLGNVQQDDSGPAQFSSAVALPSNPPKLGGFSGIELTPTGQDMLLISDRGRVVRGHLTRQDGHLTAANLDPVAPLMTSQGRRVRGKGNDAEGLALAADGTVFVSFEGVHRVLAYDPGRSRARDLPIPAAFARLPGNGGLEALALDPTGALIALVERAALRGPTAFRLAPQGWQPLPGYHRNRGFLPVGADLGPDGRMYILERHFIGLGFSSRVRSFQIDATGLHDPQLILTTRPRQHGNLEGLSVWRDTQGKIRLTMVSDDNFLSLLPNELVEYSLPNPLANTPATD